MEGPGKVAAHSVTDPACGRDGGEEEGGSHFQKLLQLPEPSAASKLQIISSNKIDLPEASLEPGASPTHLQDRDRCPLYGWNGSRDPHSLGLTHGERTPAHLLSSVLLWESVRKRPAAQQEEQKLGSSWLTFFLRREKLECSRKKSCLALWRSQCTEVKSLKSGFNVGSNPKQTAGPGQVSTSLQSHPFSLETGGANGARPKGQQAQWNGLSGHTLTTPPSTC